MGGTPVARRGDSLELAVLGLLHESPMHGYELRKRVNAIFGWGRVLSYGSLYPCLKALLRSQLIVEQAPVEPAGRRARIVYLLTDDGKDRFDELMRVAGPAAWDDDSFDVHFAFFSRTDRHTRVRILEGRRSRLEERMDAVRAAASRTAERLDAYTIELQRHGLESVEREVRWLTELIDTELAAGMPTPGAVGPASNTAHNQGNDR